MTTSLKRDYPEDMAKSMAVAMPGYWRDYVVFDPLLALDFNPKLTSEQAHNDTIRERNEFLRQCRAKRDGFEYRGSRLTGQLQPWKSFGVPDGRTRTIYYVQIRKPA